MKRKLINIFIFLLVVFAFCCKINYSEKTEIELDSGIEGNVTDESMSLPMTETEEIISSKDNKKAKITQPEKTQEENEKINVQDTDEQNNSAETEKINEDILECTLSVSCNTVFEKITEIDKEKLEILPPDGVIFPESKVIFYDGESVFNVLKRELKKNGIHIDFVSTPMYNSVYIRGISNLYEHDCGELSGWIYTVNEKVPKIGCSQYILKNGDRIAFIYTCNLGKDIEL